MSGNSLRTQNSETKKPTFESSVKGGIIALCTLFATFSFEAALNPSGGLWQDRPPNNITNATEIAKAANFTQSWIYIRPQNFLLKLFHEKPIPRSDFTAPDLYGPGKAMNIALAPYDFVFYLALDAMCYCTSLLTIAVLTLSSINSSSWSIIPIIGVELILIFALGIYCRVVAMVTNEQFAEWALRIGFIGLLSVTIVVFFGASVFAYVCVILKNKCLSKRNMGEGV